MAGTKEIKRRIKSVKNTKKITKAMELVAASKMKKVVSKTLASREYAHYSWDLLTAVSKRLKEERHPFFLERKNAERHLFILITSNRGLCGGYNAQVLKRAIGFFKGVEDMSMIDVVVIGRKGNSAIHRLGLNTLASFINLPDSLTLRDVAPISEMIIEEFQKGIYRDVHIAYTDYVSAMLQKPRIRKILPVSKAELQKAIESLNNDTAGEMNVNTKQADYIFEGDMEELIGSLAKKLVKMQVYQMILESGASEQSARMISMKNAGDAAGEMIDDLTLVFNKARQANITREISEISAGMTSLS